MAGTKVGGLKAAETNKFRYGRDFYSRLGRIGGKVSRTGGFASYKIGADGLSGRQRARTAGTIGGKKSRRGAKS